MGAQGEVAPVRVALDTNVVLSALVSAGGRLQWLRAAWQQAQLAPVVNQFTVTELLRVLTYPKFRLGPAEREELLADYLPHCEIVGQQEPLALPPLRDPADAMFLQLACTARAPYLVTGDADLLSLAGAALPAPVSIVTPEQLRAVIHRE